MFSEFIEVDNNIAQMIRHNQAKYFATTSSFDSSFYLWSNVRLLLNYGDSREYLKDKLGAKFVEYEKALGRLSDFAQKGSALIKLTEKKKIDDSVKKQIDEMITELMPSIFDQEKAITIYYLLVQRTNLKNQSTPNDLIKHHAGLITTQMMTYEPKKTYTGGV